jgi:hypothetical protein
MFGETDVRSIDAWRGSFARKYSSALALIAGSELTAFRYRSASSGEETVANRLK